MNWLWKRKAEVPEKRNIADPQPWVVQLLGRGSQTTTGVWVNPDTALRNVAVFACVRIISKSIAMLPLNVYRRLPKGGKELALDFPLFNTLHFQPNNFQTSFEWRQMMTAHVLLRGNAYSRIDRSDYDGRVLDLLPLHPDRIKPYRRPNGEMWYEYRPINGPVEQFSADEMFHLRGLTTDGIMGISPVTLAREAIGLAMAQEEYSGRFYSNDATPPIVLKHPEALSAQAHSRLVQSVKEHHAGLPNAHAPWVLEEGMEIEKIGVEPRNAQFLEGRNFSVVEICRLFDVPPHMVAQLDRATFSNIEQQSIEFVKFTLLPWLTAWKQALHVRLFSSKAQGQYFPDFMIRDLLMGDMASRAGYYATMRQWGNINANEVREMEGFNPREDPGGDAFLEPLNMNEEGIGDAGPKQTPSKPKQPAPPADEGQEPNLQRALMAAMREKAERLLAKEAKALKRISEKKTGPEFVREADKFFNEQFAEAPPDHVRESRRLLTAALGNGGVPKVLETWNARAPSLAETLYQEGLRCLQ